MKSIVNRITLIVSLSIFTVFSADAQDGKALFTAKCAACHTIGTNRLVGPGLAGINEKRSREWLLSWIKDSQALIKTGDKDANAIFEEYSKIAMIPFTDMSDAEIIAVLDYVKGDASLAKSTTEVAVVAQIVPIEYSIEEIEVGKLLFTGEKRFLNGGASCISCHNVTNNDINVPGGLLAKDLTNVY